MILVADDEDGVREIARRVLAREGFNVLTASSGREALAQLEGHSGRIDLVLTDFMMPEMSGAELADRVRELSEETKVLFMSGFSAEATAGSRPGALAHEHLQKPFDAAELVRRVGKLLPA